MKKLTILLDDHIYEGLHRVAGRGNIGNFVAEKITPFLVEKKKSAPSMFGILNKYVRPFDEKAVAQAAYEHYQNKYKGQLDSRLAAL